jgi:hypothetical protein
MLQAVVLAALLAPAMAAAESPSPETPPSLRLQASLGYHYSTGNYSDPETTSIYYVPLVVRGEIDAWAVELTLPYLHIRGPEGIFGVVGDTSTDNDSDIERQQGVGDVLLALSYTFWPWWKYMPFFTGMTRIKFPSASEGKGLGTGEFDYYLSGQAIWLAGALTPFVEVGVEFLGDSSQVELQDAARLSAGSSYSIGGGFSAGLALDYGSPTSNDAGHRIDLVPFLNWQLTPSWSLAAYGSAGLASGSPDAGAGVQIAYRLYENAS